MAKKHKRFKARLSHQQIIGAVIVVLVAGLGVYLLAESHAASPYASSEAESGTLANGATIVSDSNASGSSAVKFGGATTNGFSWPVAMSANKRYLVDQNGQPYMIVGDSPHSLIVNLTEADADAYFADRQAHGFNAAWVELLCDAYTGGRANGPTYDGIAPFTTTNNFATPNPAYFQRALDMVNIAAKHGITVFLDPIDTAGWQSQYEQNGATVDGNYGKYLGNFFKNAPNILWITGNDYQTWETASDDADITAIANGIKSTDPNHLQTTELNYEESSSLDDQNWANIISLNGVYTYYPTYDEVLHAYNQTPTMPNFMEEANYEFEDNNGTDNGNNPITLRLQEYWTMTSGATGQMYGNHYTWDDGTNWADEQTHLDTTGVQQLQYMSKLFDGLPWQNLVPDQSHAFVTAGYGTYATGGLLNNSNYVTAEVDAAGSTGVAYLPKSTTVTVAMTKMRGTVTARWYDPTTGTFSSIGSFANTGTHQFTSPASHGDGTDDWVLVLTA